MLERPSELDIEAQIGRTIVETLPRSATSVEIDSSGMRKHFVLP